MTAEIAILNRSGIAIAADSAITVGNERVWQSSNKLFSLGPNHDIALMIYGSGDFGGCPWEILIKEFRSHCTESRFESLSDCIEEFQTFIREERWHDEEAEVIANAHLIVSRIEYLLEGLEFEGKIDFRNKVVGESKRLREQLKEHDVFLQDLSYAEFERRFGAISNRFLREITDRVITKAVNTAVLKYIYEFYRRESCSTGYDTGIVFLGYGASEIYPAVQEWIFDGRVEGHFRMWPWRIVDLNHRGSPAGVIVAFAQKDMAQLFMEGISPNYVSFFLEILGGILKDKSQQVVDRAPDAEKVVEEAIQEKDNKLIMATFAKTYHKMKQREVVNPLMGAIRALPREEMMAMAEAFVELTSMRRKVDSNLQTVGGPVDVAFISKGDGFIWGKRKLYFDADLNGDYFKRRAKRLS